MKKMKWVFNKMLDDNLNNFWQGTQWLLGDSSFWVDIGIGCQSLISIKSSCSTICAPVIVLIYSFQFLIPPLKGIHNFGLGTYHPVVQFHNKNAVR